MTAKQRTRVAIGYEPDKSTPLQPARQNIANKDIRNYFAALRKLSDGANDTNGLEWTTFSELPPSDEVCGSNVVNLHPNRINGPWSSPHVYLEAHYRLLREDSVAPLSDAVHEFKEHPSMADSRLSNIYDTVHIAGVTYNNRGLAFRVQFSTARAGKNIVWEYSKRLTTGTLVALTPVKDCFKSKCILAVVAARPIDGLKSTPAEIDLWFAHPGDVDFDPQQEFFIIEAKSGYYEAYRHVMTSLQKMTLERFPFTEYLCDLKPDVEVPDHILADPYFDFSELFSGTGEKMKHVDILKNWPPPPKALDNSQWDALNQILTKKLAIVQGPPGTGKTFVSVVALKLLLSRLTDDDPPIIIAAQTNHALDQLIRHVAAFEDRYIRIGSRSTDLDIKKRTLFEVRKRGQNMGGGGSSRRRLKLLQDRIARLLSPFEQENSDRLLPAELFLDYKIISEKQYEKLYEESRRWIKADKGSDNPLEFWLSKKKRKFEVQYEDMNFGFIEDEIDLEYEQLKELEAEHGVDEEDIEGLKGDYVPLKEGFRPDITRVPPNSKEEERLQKLMQRDSLFKIPEAYRGTVYAEFQKRLKDAVRAHLRQLLKEYETLTTAIKCEGYERDVNIFEGIKVVGMTTTGLSKYRPLVSALKPKIFLIEEAAEVIEAPVTCACMDSLEHLVLVGDHQQLQGQCTVRELENEPYYLNVSMFERLVHNGIDFRTLLRQRRMAPEIRRVLNPIYPRLEDHECVVSRPPIPGMGGLTSFWFHHQWNEQPDSLMSRTNDSEAQMIVALYTYLHLNGVSCPEITILTFYNGQRKKILKYLRENRIFEGQYVKVHTVDSYQGEENEVVLLSLVRSNDNDSLGFLGIENRACVALSRARRGFYIFGNAGTLCSNSLWSEVIQIMSANPKRIGAKLPLVCEKHGAKTLYNDPKQIFQSEGGCSQKCDELMPCGHPCTLQCHPFSHDRISCPEPCASYLTCGHLCAGKCGGPCRCAYKCPTMGNDPAVLPDTHDGGEEVQEVVEAPPLDLGETTTVDVSDFAFLDAPLDLGEIENISPAPNPNPPNTTQLATRSRKHAGDGAKFDDRRLGETRNNQLLTEDAVGLSPSITNVNYPSAIESGMETDPHSIAKSTVQPAFERKGFKRYEFIHRPSPSSASNTSEPLLVNLDDAPTLNGEQVTDNSHDQDDLSSLIQDKSGNDNDINNNNEGSAAPTTGQLIDLLE